MAGGITGRARQDRGSAAVELAIVLPVLLLLVFGITDAGRALESRLIIDRSAAYGARLAAIGRSNVPVLIQTAAAAAGPVTVAVTGCVPGVPGDASVTVTGQAGMNLPGLPAVAITLTSTAVQPCEP